MSQFTPSLTGHRQPLPSEPTALARLLAVRTGGAVRSGEGIGLDGKILIKSQDASPQLQKMSQNGMWRV